MGAPPLAAAAGATEGVGAPAFLTEVAALLITAAVAPTSRADCARCRSSASWGAIRRLIVAGGGLQVALAIAMTAGLCLLVGASVPEAVFGGMLVALSSTAIVLKLLAERGATDSHGGREQIALLIFQDLAIVAFVLMVPMLGGEGGSALDMVIAVGRAALVVAAVLFGARRVMPRLLEAVARACSQEVFLLVVIAICIGTAYVSGLLIGSVTLGAFLAGLLVGDSAFDLQALGEIIPLQALFSAVFFLSVGMLLDPAFLVGNLPLVLAVVVMVAVVKLLTTGAAVAALRDPRRSPASPRSGSRRSASSHSCPRASGVRPA